MKRKKRTVKKTATRGSRRKNPAKSDLWVIFKCKGKSVLFLGLDSKGKHRFYSSRNKAIQFKFTENPMRIATWLSKQRGMSKYHFGVTTLAFSNKQISDSCMEKV